MLKRVVLAVIIIVIVVIALLLVRRWILGDDNLLMSATYGEASDGSYVRWENADVIEWRSRTHFVGPDMADPPSGYGFCVDPGADTSDTDEGHLDDTYGFYRLDRVFLFDGTRPFHLDRDRIIYTPRPVDFLSQPEDGIDNARLDALEGQLREGGVLGADGPALGELGQQDPRPNQDDTPDLEGDFSDLGDRADRDAYTDAAVQLLLVDRYQRRLARELQEIYGDEAAATILDRYRTGDGLRSLIPTPVELGDDDFGEALTRLVQRISRAEGSDQITEVTIGLDFVLQPMMSHAIGADDPTPVPGDAVSEAFATDAATQPGLDPDGRPRRIWIADYGLPIGANQALWPNNITHVASLGGQTSPLSGDPLTSEYGHGLMVASVAAQVATDANVTVINVAETDPTGRQWVTTSSIDEGLLAAGVLAFGESTLNFSLGAYDCVDLGVGDTGDLTVTAGWREGLRAVLEPYTASTGIQVVAGAGNDASEHPLYPAAFDEVIGVAAVDDTVLNSDDCLAPDGIESYTHLSETVDVVCQPDPEQLALFSNSGVNEEEKRPGVDLVVNYPLLASPIVYDYLGHQPVPLDTGKVRISGTSLASPRYAACLQSDGTTKC